MTSSDSYSLLLDQLKGARLIEVAFHAMGAKLTFASGSRTISLEGPIPTRSSDGATFDQAMADLSSLLSPLIDHELCLAEWIEPGAMRLRFDNDVTIFLRDRENLTVDYAFSIRNSDDDAVALLE